MATYARECGNPDETSFRTIQRYMKHRDTLRAQDAELIRSALNGGYDGD